MGLNLVNMEVDMKYRKKPVEVDAVKIKVGERFFFPDWLMDAVTRNDILIYGFGGPREMVIKTLEGNMVAREGDWIIKGTRGEIYPCKDGPFQDTFEPVT
jgi:hypothetical protein